MAKTRKATRWFKSEQFLWGWYPIAWQGWVVCLFYIGLLLYGSWVLLPHNRAESVFDAQRILVWLTLVLFCLLTLTMVVWKTGGKPARTHHGKPH